MAVSQTYTDGYLKSLVTDEIEGRAEEDVKAINAAYPEPWISKLIVVRAYILTCGENCKSDTDIFHTKLKFYEGEWKSQLNNANAAFNAGSKTPTLYGSLSIPILRA